TSGARRYTPRPHGPGNPPVSEAQRGPFLPADASRSCRAMRDKDLDEEETELDEESLDEPDLEDADDIEEDDDLEDDDLALDDDADEEDDTAAAPEAAVA